MNRIEHLAENVTLHLGDCREVLPTLGKVDAVVTDPAYGVNAARDRNSQKWGWRDYDAPGWDTIKLGVLYFVMFDSRVHALEHERWFHDTLLPEERLCGEWCRLAAELATESVETCMDYCAVGRCSYSLMNSM